MAVVECPRCGGHGDLPCPSCEGRGCQACDQTGDINCPACKGEEDGERTIYEIVEVR